jgi:hypothetical protein
MNEPIFSRLDPCLSPEGDRSVRRGRGQAVSYSI